MQLLEVEKNLITHNVTIKHVNIGELASGFLTLGEVQVQHYHQSHICYMKDETCPITANPI